MTAWYGSVTSISRYDAGLLDAFMIHAKVKKILYFCNGCNQAIKGQPGGIASHADFYAIMPPYNFATVAPGADVDFPSDAPTSSCSITRSGSNTFTLSEVGTYLVMYSINITEIGQLVVTLNGDIIY